MKQLTPDLEERKEKELEAKYKRIKKGDPDDMITWAPSSQSARSESLHSLYNSKTYASIDTNSSGLSKRKKKSTINIKHETGSGRGVPFVNKDSASAMQPHL